VGELVDLVGSDGLHGCEVVEGNVDEHAMQLLARLAPGIRAELARAGRLHDCRWAVPAWLRALERQGLGPHVCNEPDPEEQPRADFTHMTEAERGGYEIERGVIRRHVWLAPGSSLSLFDPTAHQFDSYGHPALARYWRQNPGCRLPFAAWRALELGRSP
jgi:hypothetical protein